MGGERLEISAKDQIALRRWAAARNRPYSLVLRAKIVLLSATGRPDRRIARELGVSAPTVGLWRRRYAAKGLAGIEQDAPRSGRPRKLSQGQARLLFERILRTKPPHGQAWTVRALADASGLSRSTAHRLYGQYRKSTATLTAHRPGPLPAEAAPPGKTTFGTQRFTRVALVIAIDGGFGRGVWQGAKRFADGRDWTFSHALPQNFSLAELKRWEPDGIIGDLLTRELAAELAKLRKPLINISGVLDDLDLPRIGVNDRELGRFAAQYFLDRGFRNFAFFGHPGEAFSREREAGFRQRVADAGLRCSSHLETELFRGEKPHWWGAWENRFQHWLLALPRPVGLLACNDARASQVAEACHKIGLKIPGEIALLGVDDDPLFCRTVRPELSSVVIPAERIGYLAAAFLDTLMAQKPLARRQVLLPPDRIAARQSTDILAVADPDVRAALAFIHAHAGQRCSVGDILRAVPVSRRMLEQRFRKHLGRSPLEEIRRATIEYARGLLAMDPAKSIAEVARAAGFSSPEHFTTVFRSVLGVPPRDYRAALQPAPQASPARPAPRPPVNE